MRANPRFLGQPKEFWANVRTIGQEVGYSESRKEGGKASGKLPALAQIREKYLALQLSTAHLLMRCDYGSTWTPCTLPGALNSTPWCVATHAADPQRVFVCTNLGQLFCSTDGGAPVVTTARAMVQALQDAKAQDIAVVTPYQDAVNAQIKLFLTDGGIRVRAFDSLYAKDVDALGRINPDEVAAIARSTMNDDCDAMLIVCSQLPAFAILDRLRADFRRPVLSSIQSTAWQVQRTLGL